MITRVQNINFAPLKSKLKTKKISKEPENNSKKCHLFYPKNIIFKGHFQIQTKQSFQNTLNENYFQLPQINFTDGSTYQLRPDKYQLECAKRLYEGDSVIFCAPTGTGKTAVAHYITTLNLQKGKKTIYTTPLKALANDKLREFRKIYGNDNVGLLTGDIKLNTNAPIQIMTTEIYNNQSSSLKENSKNIGTVIFDEAHYISDEDRGNVWENSIINTPSDKVQILCLSATIGNSDEFTDWISTISPKRKISKIEVNPKERFVPLIWYIYQENPNTITTNKNFIPIKEGFVDLSNFDIKNPTERQKRALEVIFKTQNNINEYYEMTSEQYETQAKSLKETIKGQERIDEETFKNILKRTYHKLNHTQLNEITQFLIEQGTEQTKRIYPKHHDDDYCKLIENLKENDMLPALIFKLSKKSCSNIAQNLKEKKIDLTTDEEKEQISKIIKDYQSKNIFLGDNFDKKMLLSGFAYHHAGILPAYKKLIEELFSKKLLKVVIATSTLSAGINMPAKTTVISDTSFKKYNPLTQEVEYQDLSTNDFHQMAGRAGRRGIDSLGYVILYNLKTNNFNSQKNKQQTTKIEKQDELHKAYDLIDSPLDKLKSHFKPDWQMLAKYFENNSTMNNLEEIIVSSFKVYLSKDPEKTKRSLLSKFENYKAVLLKQGFIQKNNNEIHLTPKGKILTLSQGLNPLMLATLVYDEKFKNLNYEQLCQMIGYIAISITQKENENMPSLLNQRFYDILKYETDFENQKTNFNNTRKIFQETEEKILKNLLGNKIPLDEIIYSDSFSGYCGYLWAHLNNKNNDSISNFRKLTNSGCNPLTHEQMTNTKDAAQEYLRKTQEGNVYSIISQMISILKQIDKICDFAIQNKELYPNQKYYLELKENAQLATILIKQNPIYDETSL